MKTPEEMPSKPLEKISDLKHLRQLYEEWPPFIYHIDTGEVEKMPFEEWIEELIKLKDGYANTDKPISDVDNG